MVKLLLITIYRKILIDMKKIYQFLFCLKMRMGYKWREFHSEKLFDLKLKFISWVHGSGRMATMLCWADCVTWAFASNRLNPFKIDSPGGCKEESSDPETHTCYCGQWVDGQCFALLTHAQQEVIRERNQSAYEDLEPHLPF